MQITVAQLIRAGIQPTQARIFVNPLNEVLPSFGISSPVCVSAFVAQCNVESAGFTMLEENLNYRTPERLMKVFPSRVKSLADAAALVKAGPKAIANRVYAGKIGNGDERSGDGWAFRGRGLKMLTGRANYADAAVELDEPYDRQPDLVAEPLHAVVTSAWFWRSKRLNVLAESAQYDLITRAVNGPGMLQASLRKQLSEEGVRAFA